MFRVDASHGLSPEDAAKAHLVVVDTKLMLGTILLKGDKLI